ncbi:heat shock protein 20 [Trypanosoma theileri]|uniref:Heat shock protein 20 n=1 Tax=Trypanosoma theileri TaxID=67003 RepID=A0A1X0P9Y3_9TRYP|nr:heat shock protein 20 [Trypanosoma theileri]ORC93443.1 heat shock protein 20 [Trypanosoma theileri]
MWDPFRDFDRLLNRMHSSTLPGFITSTVRGTWVPALDLIEKPDGYKLIADLPGMNREDVSVDIDGTRICIGGNRKALTKEDEGHLTMIAERGSGRFERCLQLPTPLVEDSVKASLKNSVLVVEVKKDEAKTDRTSTPVKIQ